MYGIDFERYRVAANLMIIAGGVSASIDFLYAIITVLRHQSSATKPYLITFAFALVVPTALIWIIGLDGAVIGYLASMTLLLTLLASSTTASGKTSRSATVRRSALDARRCDAAGVTPLLRCPRATRGGPRGA